MPSPPAGNAEGTEAPPPASPPALALERECRTCAASLPERTRRRPIAGAVRHPVTVGGPFRGPLRRGRGWSDGLTPAERAGRLFIEEEPVSSPANRLSVRRLTSGGATDEDPRYRHRGVH